VSLGNRKHDELPRLCGFGDLRCMQAQRPVAVGNVTMVDNGGLDEIAPWSGRRVGVRYEHVEPA